MKPNVTKLNEILELKIVDWKIIQNSRHQVSLMGGDRVFKLTASPSDMWFDRTIGKLISELDSLGITAPIVRADLRVLALVGPAKDKPNIFNIKRIVGVSGTPILTTNNPSKTGNSVARKRLVG